MPSLYALLVAINAYPPPIDSLDGCLNDADSVEAMLRARFDAESLHLLRIQDSAATRQAVIDSFRSHLGQAQTCDLALFFFAGHGSQVPTGGQFSTVEPSGLNSSIVCYDSRLPNGLDLVDKDMAVLISEVTAKGAHLTTVFDSCHSGSMDRALGVRRVNARPDPQPASKYLADPAALEAAIRDLPAMQNTNPITLASAACSKPGQSGPHILLAACETDQTAQEYIDPNTEENHGAFTYFLTDTLNRTKAGLGYRELMHLTRAAMSVDVPLQTPKAESSSGDHMLDDLFLGFDAAAQTDYAIAAFGNTTNQWQLDRGATLNIAAGDRYALYPVSAADADLADPGKAFAFATVTQVRPAAAVLQPDPTPALDEGSQYKTVAVDASALDHAAIWKKRLALTNPNTQIPAAAIECKTYLDKTMLEGASMAAEQLKFRNPNALYLVVCEWLKLTENVNLRKFKVDQIYVLRKQKNTDREFRFLSAYEKKPIYLDVVEHLFNTVRAHLTSNWEGGVSFGLQKGYLL